MRIRILSPSIHIRTYLPLVVALWTYTYMHAVTVNKEVPSSHNLSVVQRNPKLNCTELTYLFTHVVPDRWSLGNSQKSALCLVKPQQCFPLSETIDIVTCTEEKGSP